MPTLRIKCLQHKEKFSTKVGYILCYLAAVHLPIIAEATSMHIPDRNSDEKDVHFLPIVSIKKIENRSAGSSNAEDMVKVT
jgi:hypothetical protein